MIATPCLVIQDKRLGFTSHQFQDIKIGGFFEYGSCLYLKINGLKIRTVNVLNLTTLQIRHFCDTTPVKPRKAEPLVICS